MATIGNLVVNLGLNTAPFQKGAAVARGMAGKLGSGLMMAGKGAAIAGAAIATAGVAAGAGLAALATQSLGTIDKLAKTSDKLGIATEELAGLRHAAELTGAGTDTLDTSLEKMVIRLSDAAQGSGQAVGALQELGMSAQDLAGLSPDEQFRRIAGAMQGVANQSDKARLAYDIFGRSGVSLVNTLALGEDGLKKVTDEAKALGIAVSRPEAAKIEELNDSIYRIKSAFTGLGHQAAIAFAPLIQQSMPAIISGMKTFLSVTKTVFSGIVDVVLLAQFEFQNWRQIVDLNVLHIQLRIVQLSGVITHFFTGTLPALFSWFTDNWKEIFFTAFDIATTVFINIGKNIRALFSNVMGIISGELRFGDLFKGVETDLTKGFANSIKELPNLPPRVVGELEQKLSSDFETMFSDVAMSAEQFIAEKRAKLFGGGALGSMPDFSGADMPGGSGSGGQLAGPAANMRGSVEAFSAVQKVLRGGRDAEQKKIAQSTKMTAQASREAADSLKLVADNTAGLTGLATEGF